MEAELQELSYLKSLERRNRPRHLHRNLLLPNPEVRYSVEKVFDKTGEAVFERIFHRPIGHKCFQEFVESIEVVQITPCAALVVKFLHTIKNLASQPPGAALTTIDALKRDFIDSQTFVLNDVCQSPMLRAELDNKRMLLLTKLQISPHQNTNIKDCLQHFVGPCKEYLSGEPWQAFLKSSQWVRYCQFKHLELNQKISQDDFAILRILGRGGFGEVYGCRKHDTGAVFAVKCLDKRRLKLKHQEASAVHERNVLAEMHSRFVTNLKYAFHNETTLYLVLDLMEGGDLSYHLKKVGHFTENEARFYAAEISMGLSHIHSRQMIYRDLKPANILLDAAGHARISDLGLARDIKKNLPTSECGTHGYMAPEVLAPGKTYNTSADWWSFGCVVYHMLVGYSPFRGPSRKISKEEVDRRTMDMVVDYPSNLSFEGRELLSALLERNVSGRLGSRRGASEIRNHAWFASIDWQALADHQLQPPITPSSTQVNAKDANEIERFDDAEMKKIQISEAENNKYYKHFYHVMSHQWQEEILESSYAQMTALANTTEMKRRSQVLSKATETENSVPGNRLFQGYVLKLGGVLNLSWRRRYLYLLTDRLQWHMEQLQPVKNFVLLESILKLSDVVHKGQRTIQVVTESKTYYFRTEYRSDHDVWLESVHVAMLRRVKEKTQSESAHKSQVSYSSALAHEEASAQAQEEASGETTNSSEEESSEPAATSTTTTATTLTINQTPRTPHESAPTTEDRPSRPLVFKTLGGTGTKDKFATPRTSGVFDQYDAESDGEGTTTASPTSRKQPKARERSALALVPPQSGKHRHASVSREISMAQTSSGGDFQEEDDDD
eukprot:m.894882 g.894882  ORF g.894882 m.894882 type:complete len:840 (+) comp59989_c0_seq10:2907-5426(+)